MKTYCRAKKNYMSPVCDNDNFHLKGFFSQNIYIPLKVISPGGREMAIRLISSRQVKPWGKRKNSIYVGLSIAACTKTAWMSAKAMQRCFCFVDSGSESASRLMASGHPRSDAGSS